jgi:hypothetical protein
MYRIDNAYWVKTSPHTRLLAQFTLLQVLLTPEDQAFIEPLDGQEED